MYFALKLRGRLEHRPKRKRERDSKRGNIFEQKEDFYGVHKINNLVHLQIHTHINTQKNLGTLLDAQ